MYYGAYPPYPPPPYPPYPQTGGAQGATPPGPVLWPPQGYAQPAPQVGVSGTPQETSQGQAPQGQVPSAAAPQGPAPYGAPPAASGWVPPSGYQPAYPMAAPARDPRKKGASSTINRMGLLLLAQVALSFIWQFPLQMLLALVGVDLFRNALGYQWLSGVLVPLSTALPFAA